MERRRKGPVNLVKVFRVEEISLVGRTVRVVPAHRQDREAQEEGLILAQPGPFRLFIEPLASQTAWLLPLAWHRRPRFQSDRKQQSMLLWGMWLLTMGVFFSVAGFFHQYYLTEMAPAIAALFGIGIVAMWRDYRSAGWRGYLLPLELVATAVEQIYILTNYPAWGQWLIPVIALFCVLGAAALLILRNADFGKIHRQFLLSALSVAILGLMIAPTVWAAIPVVENVQAQLPVAGPTQQRNFGGSGGANNGTNVNTALISYLEAHLGAARDQSGPTGWFDSRFWLSHFMIGGAHDQSAPTGWSGCRPCSFFMAWDNLIIRARQV
jgi:hypothetical protein